MIRHQHLGVHPPAGALADLAQSRQEAFPVPVIPKNRFASIAPVKQMIHRACELDTSFPGHELNQSPRLLAALSSRFAEIHGPTPFYPLATVFMNTEVAGLPRENPKRSPFSQRRSMIRAILNSHKNEHGLFLVPVAVGVTGPLFWDGEHRYPNNVGPEGLRLIKAWEIHPVKLLTER